MGEKTVAEIVEIFKSKSFYVNMGAGKLSKQFRCSKQDIYDARSILRTGSKSVEMNKDIVFNHNKQKILFLDIETAPMRSYTWGRWKQNISLSQTISEWFIISWSAKFVKFAALSYYL